MDSFSKSKEDPTASCSGLTRGAHSGHGSLCGASGNCSRALGGLWALAPAPAHTRAHTYTYTRVQTQQPEWLGQDGIESYYKGKGRKFEGVPTASSLAQLRLTQAWAPLLALPLAGRCPARCPLPAPSLSVVPSAACKVRAPPHQLSWEGDAGCFPSTPRPRGNTDRLLRSVNHATMVQRGIPLGGRIQRLA